MKKIIIIMLLALSFSVLPTITYGANQTYIVKVNGVTLKTSEGQAFKSGSYTYVPLNAIAKKMGDAVTWDKKKLTVVIKKKNKTTITVKANATTASVNNKRTALVTKKEKGKTVNAKVKSLYKNNILYIPVQFASNPKTLNYTIKTGKEKGKPVIYVVKSPASEPSIGRVGKTYPDGWVAPVLKSAWSPNSADNFRALKNELGFVNGGFSYNIEGASNAIFIDGTQNGSYEVTLNFSMWDGDANGRLKQAYRIPIVAKELFKLYFGSDATRVWNYLNTGDIPDQFTANGRTVKASYDTNGGILSLEIVRK